MVLNILKVIAITLCTNILIANAVTTYDVGIESKVELVSNTEADIKQRLFFYTEKYGISSQNALLIEVIRCESQFNQYAIGDKGHSRGLVQIFDEYHPDITHEQAFDVNFSLEFLVKNVAEGRGYWWTCYRKNVN